MSCTRAIATSASVLRLSLFIGICFGAGSACVPAAMDGGGKTPPGTGGSQSRGSGGASSAPPAAGGGQTGTGGQAGASTGGVPGAGGAASSGESGGSSAGTGGRADGGSTGSASGGAGGSASDAGGAEAGGSPPPSSPKLATDIFPIVKMRCALSGCHDAIKKEHGMNLSTPALVHSLWVNHETADHCRNNTAVTRVVPNNPSDSFVVVLIEAQAGRCKEQLRMPPAPLPQLPADEVKKIRDWIAAGALND